MRTTRSGGCEPTIAGRWLLSEVIAVLDQVIEAVAHTRRSNSISTIQRDLERSLSTAFTLHGQRFLSLLSKQRGRFPPPTAAESRRSLREAESADARALPPWEEAFDQASASTVAAYEAPLEAAAAASLEAGAAELLGQLGLDLAFDLANPAAQEYIAEHGAELVTGLNATSKEQLRNLIAAGIEEGKSYGQIATDIRNLFADWSKARAELVAVTEVGMGYETGNAQAAAQLQAAGLEMEHAWLTVGDDRVDPDCRANEDAGWIPLDAEFPSGDLHPLAHPRCRCTNLYRRKPDDD